MPRDYVTVYGAKVIGVQSLQSYNACISCKAKVDPTDDDTGLCCKGSMYQPLNRCKQQLSAKILIENGEEFLSLSAFGSIVSDIAQCSDVTTNSLLYSKPFNMTYANNIITSVLQSDK